jgi:hypothetical protein
VRFHHSREAVRSYALLGAGDPYSATIVFENTSTFRPFGMNDPCVGPDSASSAR